MVTFIAATLTRYYEKLSRFRISFLLSLRQFHSLERKCMKQCGCSLAPVCPQSSWDVCYFLQFHRFFTSSRIQFEFTKTCSSKFKLVVRGKQLILQYSGTQLLLTINCLFQKLRNRTHRSTLPRDILQQHVFCALDLFQLVANKRDWTFRLLQRTSVYTSVSELRKYFHLRKTQNVHYG